MSVGVGDTSIKAHMDANSDLASLIDTEWLEAARGARHRRLPSRYSTQPSLPPQTTTHKISSVGAACSIAAAMVSEGNAAEAPPREPDVKTGAVENQRDSSALMLAAEEGDASLVKLLLDNDADPFAQDLEGKTAKTYAFEVLQKLEEKARAELERVRLEFCASATEEKQETLGLQLAMSRAMATADADMKGHRDSIKYIDVAMRDLSQKSEESRKVNGVRGYAPVLRRRPGEQVRVRQPGEFQLKSHRLAPGDLSDWESIMEHIKVFDEALQVPSLPRPATSSAFGGLGGGAEKGRPASRQRPAPRSAHVLQVMRIKMLEESTKREAQNKAATRAAAAALAGPPIEGEQGRGMFGWQPGPSFVGAPPSPSPAARVHHRTKATKNAQEQLRGTTKPKDARLSRLVSMRHQGFSGPVRWRTGDSAGIYLAGQNAFRFLDRE